MRSILRVAAAVLAFAFLLPSQQFVVANRGSGDITVFDRDGAVLQTVPLPAAARTPEPMYVVQVGDEVVVGDRANDRVVRFDKGDYSVTGTVPVGQGVFHMWSNGDQLWVNNDIDDTTSVVDVSTWTVMRTVPTPGDLVAQGYKPHDVFVARNLAYVSLVGGTGTDDWIVQFSTRTFAETGRAPVGKDPHLWCDSMRNRLYVPTQNGNSVHVLNARTLQEIETIAQPGAHGVFQPLLTRTLLVTDLPGGGTDGLNAYRIGGRAPDLADRIDTPAPVPHNIAASAFGDRVFVTHSGATSTKVSIHRLRGGLVGRPGLELLATTDAGTNPFGLAVVY